TGRRRAVRADAVKGDRGVGGSSTAGCEDAGAARPAGAGGGAPGAGARPTPPRTAHHTSPAAEKFRAAAATDVPARPNHPTNANPARSTPTAPPSVFSR